MLSLFTPAPAQTERREDASNYEWAEYNLPAAADLDVMRAQNPAQSSREALV